MALNSTTSWAERAKNLPLPENNRTAEQIAYQGYFVNHFYALKNYGITKKGGSVSVLINQSKVKNTVTLTLKRYINNNYRTGKIKSMDLSIFRSGKLRGMGMLITNYTDENKSQSYSICIHH